MFRDFVGNKWIIGGIVFLIVLSVACVFWYRYDTAPDRRDAAETAEAVREWEVTQKANTDNMTEDEIYTPAESTTQTAEKSITKTDSTRTKGPVFGDPKEVLAEAQLSERTDVVIKVSPYGFGPYPDVPEDLLGGMVPSWEWSEEKKLKFGPEHMRNQEAIDRVMIKLWNQGDQEFYGAVGDYNTVYPLYPNTVYIEWDDIELPDGTIHRMIKGYCAPTDFPDLTMEQQMKGEIPAGYRVLDMQADAINVSEFLNTSN